MKPLIVDLFCGEGGAGRGYQLAGFDVIGVDKLVQSRYVAGFCHDDIAEWEPSSFETCCRAWGATAIHASPPCQFGTPLRHAPRAKGGHLNLIPHTRALLEATGLPYVIENVEQVARDGHLKDPIYLEGRMFGLREGVYVLKRTRAFETNWGLTVPSDWLPLPLSTDVIVGMYGDHLRVRAKSAGGRGTRDLIGADKPALARRLMGMPWATMRGMSQAVPPAYTRWIGERLMEHLS